MRLLVLIIAFIACLQPQTAGAAANLCGHPRAPEVMVHIAAASPAFNTKLDSRTLARLPNDTLSGPPPAGVMTAGSMQGKIASDHKITFGRATNRAQGLTCIWIDRIDITLRIDPKIYLAHELHSDVCRFGAVFGHEAEHAAADAALVESYRTKIRDGLILAFGTRSDYVSGPVSLTQVGRMESNVHQNVTDTVSALFATMMRDRAARQQHIDSLAEYSRLSSRC